VQVVSPKTCHGDSTGFRNVSLSLSHFSVTSFKRRVEMMDTKRLKEQNDLRRIVEQDLGPAPARSRRASLWKCPFHGEHKGYSLVVWADGYRCFGKCQMGGDALDWLQRYRHLSFQEAVQALDGGIGPAPVITARSPEPPDDDPPPMAWQVAARRVWMWLRKPCGPPRASRP
jgi:hypothetical protein